MGKIIVIAGPTASGKSDVAVSLAGLIGAEIISADSVQVYRKMDIGSAKIKKDEMKGVRHFMIDEFDPDEEFNVSVFLERASGYIKDILERGKNVIIAGGSGLYVDSLVYRSYSFDESASGDESFRREMEDTALLKGREYVHSLLRRVDPESAEEIHPNNLKRVIRALEYYRKTGRKKSDAKGNREFRYEGTRYFCLYDDREKLYERIDRRVDRMFEEGLEDEVRSLLSQGYGESLVSMRALGYKETAAAVRGRISVEEAKYIIKRDTRRFAKRQLTWYRRNPDVRWIDIGKFDGPDSAARFIAETINE